MNRTQALGIAALTLSAIATSVSAQTVPAEQWVGPPITFSSSQSRAEVTAGYYASPSTAPQELRVGPADAPTGAMSRATVAAERNLWLRAGLGDYGDDAYMGARYTQRLADYNRMRSGPEFMAELNRIEGAKSHTTAMFTNTGPAAGQ